MDPGTHSAARARATQWEQPAGARLPLALAAACAALGLAVLAGWQFDLPALKSLHPDWVTMKANTAAGILLLGTALLVLLTAHTARRPALRLASGKALAGLVLAIGALTLAEYLLGTNTGLDRLLYAEAGPAAETFAPGRMSPATAAGFVLLGAAFLLRKQYDCATLCASQALGLLAALIAFVSVLGYAYGASSLYHFGPYTSIALHTALALLALAAALLASTARLGVLAPLADRGAGGILTRRLLSAIVVLIPLLGWLMIEGARAGWYDTEFGVAAMVTIGIAVLSALVLATARAVNRANERVARLADELEDRVRQRTAELEETNRELEAFSYSVSHDLRAPLRALDGFAQILEEEYAAALGPEGTRYAGIIRSSARDMDNLVTDLLAFSRLAREPLRKSRVDLERVAREAMDQLEPQSAGRKIVFSVAALPACEGDPTLLRQVFVNLLDNALKFTREREAALIEVGARAEASETVYHVRDNGVGFDQRYADKLFGVFQRMHHADEYEGTGIGLAIVQRIVHRHGGRVWAESEPGTGTTISFVLPGART